MNGALNFTLGLQANQFLNSANISTKALLGLTAAGAMLNTAFNKMWTAIEQGGALKDLAASASVTVKELYQLQRGFKDVGASADAVPSILNRLRRTLAGGEQHSLLKSMGLDPKAISQMNPAEQFEKIAAAMARLNVNARSQAATALFGREGAMAVMQIANSGNDFADAIQRATRSAGIWDSVAGAFDEIGDKLSELEADTSAMWAALAGALIRAFQTGRLAEVISDIVSTGFQAGLSVVPALFVKLGEILLTAFQVPLAYLKTGIDESLESLIFGKSLDPKVAKILEARGFNPADATNLNLTGETFDQKLKQNIDLNRIAIEELIAPAANEFLDESFGSAKEMLAGLFDRITTLAAELDNGSKTRSSAVGSEGFTSSSKSTKPDFTAIEKMGGVLNGLGRGFGGDDARRTADNTRKTAEILSHQTKILSDIGPALRLLGVNT
jgi:hypothetical protein